MDRFLGMALAPFVAFGLLLIARPISNLLKRKMRDSWLKRFLFISWK